MLKDWSTFREITITNPSGEPLYDYQVKVPIDPTVLTEIQSSLADLRFTQNESIIPHWIRNDGGSTPTQADSRIITVHGNVSQVTTIPDPWGGTTPVAYFDGSSFLSLAKAEDLNAFRYGLDFTIEGRLYMPTLPTSEAHVFCLGESTGSFTSLNIFVYPDGRLGFNIESYGTEWRTLTPVITAGSWYAFAIVVKPYGNNFKILIGGKNKTVQALGRSVLSSAYGCTIGARDSQGSMSNYFTGYLCDIRVSAGIARYLTDYTVSPTPLIADSYTTLLFRMNGSGSTFVEDSSKTYEAWVKVPSIPTTGTIIRMYYGNASAESTSDGNATFDVFDHFASIDTSKFTVQNATVANSILTLQTNATNGNIASLQTVKSLCGPKTRMICRLKPQYVDNDNYIIEARFPHCDTNNFMTFSFDKLPGSTNRTSACIFANGSYQSGWMIQGGLITDTYTILEATRCPSMTRWYCNSVQVGQDYDMTGWFANNGIAMLRAECVNSSACNLLVDWLFISKFVNYGPKITIGTSTPNYQPVNRYTNRSFRSTRGNNL